MSRVSPLANTAVLGYFGNFEGKSIDKIIKISEIRNAKIYQIVQYKTSKLDTSSLKIDSQILSASPGTVSANLKTRIQWNGPKVWTIVSSNISILDQINTSCSDKDFAITDYLTHVSFFK